MSRDFFDPTPEQQKVVLVDTAMLHQAEKLIESCEHCNLEGAEIPFDNILDPRHGFRSERDGLRPHAGAALRYRFHSFCRFMSLHCGKFGQSATLIFLSFNTLQLGRRLAILTFALPGRAAAKSASRSNV
jgi:hypothetical protein